MTNKNHVDFFVGQTTDGVTAPIRIDSQQVQLFCDGVFDGANVALQVSPDDLTENPDDMSWFDHPDGIFTDAGEAPLNKWNNANLSEVYLRAKLYGSGDNTSIDFKMRPRVGKAI